MKHLFTILLSLSVSLIGNAQQEFHVFPEHHNETPGSQNGTGSITQPWDLQTALSQTSDVVKSGDTIWLHEGIYNGRFVSKLKSLEPNQFITVSAYKNDKVVLNGNVNSTKTTVLEVKGKQVIYKNFEITWLGEFSRDENDDDFQACSGIRHLTGENCKFYNLKIYNNPGLGIGSWKHAAGTEIENCMIFYNGFVAKDGKGRGEGIYVQNKSDEVRLIKNNIIFNNYYKGIEVWSAGKRADFQYVKHITLEQNIIFNSGSPAGHFYDNVIVASNDKNGINVAKDISVLNNVLYHNSSQDNGNLYGNAPSLTLGFIAKAPIENVIVDGNFIIGGYNGLRILQAKSLRFTNNKIHTGIIQVGPSISDYFHDWEFNANTIYSSLKKPFRVPRVEDYSLDIWKRKFSLDSNSRLNELSDFDLDNVLALTRHRQNNHKFNLALFNAEGNQVTVDFSEYNLKTQLAFTIYDVENPNVVLKKGVLAEDYKIIFPMQLTEFEKPLHNLVAKKTLSNFGVFVIEFEDQYRIQATENNTSLLERFLNWLGF
jgi:hypothetical protein